MRPLGATQEEPVDVRIVSATHKDLAEEVKAGRFRQDLYYRLNVIDIAIPPLRQRREDLPALCEALLDRIARESGLPPKRMAAAGLQRLQQHPLPGNVRELENILHRAVALTDGDSLDLAELDQGPEAAAAPVAPPPATPTMPLAPLPDGATGPAAAAGAAIPQDLQAYLDQEERRILIQALVDARYNRTLAAQRLGISLRQMRYRIDRLRIDIPGSGDGDAD